MEPLAAAGQADSAGRATNRSGQPVGAQLALSATAVAGIGAAAAVGLADFSLVDTVVLLGVAVVLPLALGRPWW
jgi:hypothetical protein